MMSYENYRSTTGPFTEESSKNPSVLGNIVSTLTMDKIEVIKSYHGITNDNCVEYAHIPSQHGESQSHRKDTCHQATTQNRMIENDGVNASEPQNEASKALLDEIDTNTSEVNKAKGKNNILTKILRCIRKEKVCDGSTDDAFTETLSTRSLGKMLQKVNPVNKHNRENISKVFHRIGDALHANNVTSILKNNLNLKNILNLNLNSKTLNITKTQQPDLEESKNKTSNIGQRLYHQLGNTFKFSTGQNKDNKQEDNWSEQEVYGHYRRVCLW